MTPSLLLCAGGDLEAEQWFRARHTAQENITPMSFKSYCGCGAPTCSDREGQLDKPTAGSMTGSRARLQVIFTCSSRRALGAMCHLAGYRGLQREATADFIHGANGRSLLRQCAAGF